MVRVSGTNAGMHQGLLRPGISPFTRCTGSLSRTWEPGFVKREKRYDLGHYQGRFCPDLAIRSFMPRRPFIVHVCTKWTSSSPSPRVADHRISYEGDLQSLGEIETGDHRTSPGSCGSGLMSVLNSGSPYNNCWFLLALSGNHGPGCPRRPRLPSTRVPLRAVGNGSTGIVERI